MSVVSKFLTADRPENAKFLNVAEATCERGLLVVTYVGWQHLKG